ncbi:hypothetical protein G6L37_06075 [Agrobacterium rubi]|nr:hypothetical protein [Agrobacterium rubi]NTF24928.1 hypothetical protein [Agrobacterium rubi]
MHATNIDDMNDEQIVRLLCRGDCYPTAIVLHEELGWPIGGFLVDWQHRRWLPHLVHAYLIAPDGRAFDASGFRTLEQIEAFYLTPEKLKECRKPRFVEYGGIEAFRRALRPLEMGASDDVNHRYYDPDFDADQRTRYDDELDDMLASVRYAAIGRLDLGKKARLEFQDYAAAI